MPKHSTPTPEQCDAAQAARHRGASLSEVGAILGIGPHQAKDICKQQGWRIGPEALSRIRAACAKAGRDAFQHRVIANPARSAGEQAVSSGRENGEALPTGSPLTWACISAAPWPDYVPVTDAVDRR